MEKIKELVENKLKEIETKGVLDDKTINTLDTLIEIHKGIENEEYWKEKKEDMKMRYRDYDSYGEGSYGRRRRDSRGRYMEGRGGRGGRDSYSEGGSYGHHMPEMYWERMMDGYDGYMDGMEAYRRGGNYGAKDKGIESLEYMLDGLVGFLESIQDNMESPEEVEMIKKYARKIKEL